MKMLNKTIIIIGLFALVVLSKCGDDTYGRIVINCDKCYQNESCYTNDDIFQMHYCQPLSLHYINFTTYNLSMYNFSIIHKESPIVKCEKEMKIIGDKYFGYSACFRCKDLNKSLWEGTIPAGDWVC